MTTATPTINTKGTIMVISELSVIHPDPIDLQASSLTDLARRAARFYALTYKGGNEFLQAMHALAIDDAKLTDNQARWILINAIKNYRAWLKTTTDQPLTEPQTGGATVFMPLSVQPGIYTVQLEDGHRTIRIRPNLNPGPNDNRLYKISYLYGPQNTTDYQGFASILKDGRVQFWKKGTYDPKQHSALRQAVEAIATGDGAVLESAFCKVCGRTLTVPVSIHNGVGPECIKKFK